MTETEKEDCGLIPSLKKLVECSVELGTTQTYPLAQALCLSNKTVDTYWKHIKLALGVTDRYEAVRVAKEGRILGEMPDVGGGGGVINTLNNVKTILIFRIPNGCNCL